MLTEEEAVLRGSAIAARAIISAMLVELHDTHGFEAVRRVRVGADAHVEEARQRLLSGGESVRWIEDAKESVSAAERFLDDAFRAASDAEFD